MAKTQTLKAETRKRTGSGVLKQMRREGYTPSVIYGKGTENLNIKVNTKTLTDMLAHSASDSILVDLEIDGGDSQTAFLQSTQHNPVTGVLMHADFLAVTKGMTITATIPLEMHGEPVGTKSGGVVEQLIRDLEITCAPRDLPEKIEGNIEHLDIGDSISIADLDLPDGVETALEPDILVVIVNEARLLQAEEEETEGGEAAGGGEEEATGEDGDSE